MGRLIALRLRERPGRPEIARAILEHWRTVCAPRVQPIVAEWGSILNQEDGTVAVLTGENERGVRLRRSAPFASEGIINRRERTAFRP